LRYASGQTDKPVNPNAYTHTRMQTRSSTELQTWTQATLLQVYNVYTLIASGYFTISPEDLNGQSKMVLTPNE